MNKRPFFEFGFTIALLVVLGVTGEPWQNAQSLKNFEAKSGHYKCRMRLRSFDRNVDSPMWWGGSESSPKLVACQFEIWYKGRRVPVPRSVFADLSSINEVSMKPGKSGMTFVVEGGDADDGFDCLIRLRNGVVVSRRVQSGEFPTNFYEETKYVSIPFID